MTITLENIKKSSQISKQEFGQLTDLLYDSVALASKDDAQKIYQKEQTLDFLIDFLNDYYEAQEWESDASEAHFLDFLSKLHLQREILQIASGQVTLKDIQAAARSFALKTQYPVGMR